MPDAPRLVLVDGSASLYRAFHALPPLSNSRGVPTHAILGFTTILLKLLREEEPQALAVVFDGPGPTARHREFPAYKAQRPAMPDALVGQIPFVHRVLQAMRVPVLMIEGEEADDILGTVAVRAAAQSYLVRVVTADKDLLQLVGERILVRDPLAPRTFGPAEVERRYGIAPGQVADFLALMGDSSDNIPGVPGVGEKTARDLLRRFGSLETVLARAADVERPKLREALTAACRAGPVEQAIGDDPHGSRGALGAGRSHAPAAGCAGPAGDLPGTGIHPVGPAVQPTCLWWHGR